jgi:hypothetical protein
MVALSALFQGRESHASHDRHDHSRSHKQASEEISSGAGIGHHAACTSQSGLDCIDVLW